MVETNIKRSLKGLRRVKHPEKEELASKSLMRNLKI